MKTTLRSLLLCSMSLIFIMGCTGKEDSLCGTQVTWNSEVQDDYIYESLDFLTGNRTLLYEDLSTPEDICPEEHTTATFSVEFGGRTKPSDLKIYGKAYWTFYERGVELEFDNGLAYDWVAETSIGLKQAFGTNPPGWIGLQMEFVFPTRGSLDNDKAYIDSLTDNMRIKYVYHQEL